MAGARLATGTVTTLVGPYRALLADDAVVRLLAPTEDAGLICAFARRWFPRARPEPRELAGSPLAAELAEYFAGRRRTFATPVALHGTPFQRRVWDAVLSVPHGETRTYAEIATAIGAPTSVRAVGAANGANPLPPLVPCHRIVGSRGALTGYAGGIALKRRLLDVESRPCRGGPSPIVERP